MVSLFSIISSTFIDMMELGNLSVGANISGWKFSKKQDIYIVTEHLNPKCLLIAKRKMVLYSGEAWQMPP